MEGYLMGGFPRGGLSLTLNLLIARELIEIWRLKWESGVPRDDMDCVKLFVNGLTKLVMNLDEDLRGVVEGALGRLNPGWLFDELMVFEWDDGPRVNNESRLFCCCGWWSPFDPGTDKFVVDTDCRRLIENVLDNLALALPKLEKEGKRRMKMKERRRWMREEDEWEKKMNERRRWMKEEDEWKKKNVHCPFWVWFQQFLTYLDLLMVDARYSAYVKSMLLTTDSGTVLNVSSYRYIKVK